MNGLPTLEAYLGVLEGYAESLTKNAVLAQRNDALEYLVGAEQARVQDMRHRLIAAHNWTRLPKSAKRAKRTEVA